jgi:hypothetical protein
LAGRSGYGRDVKARKGAAALMAAAAMAAPAQAQMRGTAGTQTSGLGARPLMLPGPNGAKVVVDSRQAFEAALGDRAVDASAYANPATNTVHTFQGGPQNRFTIAHEMAHLFAHQVLTDEDRARFTKMLRAPGGDWDRETDSPVGNAEEWFADYYAAAATGYTGRAKRAKDGALIVKDLDAYADLGPRRIVKFKRAMDEIARARGLRPLSL